MRAGIAAGGPARHALQVKAGGRSDAGRSHLLAPMPNFSDIKPPALFPAQPLAVRFGFLFALAFFLIIAGAVFGKENLKNVYQDILSINLSLPSSLGNLTQEFSGITEDISFTFLAGIKRIKEIPQLVKQPLEEKRILQSALTSRTQEERITDLENQIGELKEKGLFVKEIARIEKIETVDQVTGEIYCTLIENGEWQKTKGECVEVAPEPTPNSELEPVSMPEPEPQP